ncbi:MULTISPECIES: hypothetical protein [Protofrankia]|nr:MULTISPECIES: hypothetical protein [Protofrankia]
MGEPGAREAYPAAKLAFELGRLCGNRASGAAGARLSWPTRQA